MQSDLLDRSFAVCRRETRRHAKSFYFASHVLPAEKRRAAYAVYTFCRHADNLVDCANQEDGSDARTGLLRLRADLHAIAAGRLPEGGIMPAFQATVRRYDIPIGHFEDLITGMEMDLRPARMETFEDLHRYCYHVASVVGLAMSRVLGAADEEALAAAADLGVAMQLTNIIRDVREDRDRGRCYLPAGELRSFGWSAADLDRGVADQRFRELMRFQVDRARRYYRLADRGIPLLPPDGSRACVVLMSRTYEAILDVVEKRGYDVFRGRAATSLVRKIGIACTSVATPLRRTGSPLRPGISTITHQQ